MKKAIASFTINDSSCWSEDKFKGKECKILDLRFNEKTGDKPGKPSNLIVVHNLPWDIYGSTTFQKEVVALVKNKYPKLKFKFIFFSEQGLQENKEADMDIHY